MKRVITLLLSALCAAGVSAQAQDNCYFPTRKGAELSYKYYNARGKELKNQWKDKRWMKFVVEEVWPSDDGMVINVGISNDIIGRMAKTPTLELAAENFAYGDVKIEGDRVTLDNMQWLADVIPEMFLYMMGSGWTSDSQYQVDVIAQTTFPRLMTVGEELPDENILDARYSEVLTPEQQAERDEMMKEMRAEMEVISRANNFTVAGDFSISAKGQTRKRKVEAFEKVETPAGAFDCYKITYELIVPDRMFGGGMIVFHDGGAMGGNRFEQQEQPGIKYADWISPEVGLVKREKYNDRGKLQEVMRLESYTK